MKAGIKVNTTDFIKAMKALSSATGKTVAQTIDAEAAAAIQATVSVTKPKNYPKSKKSIMDHAENRQYITKKGKVYFVGKPSIKTYQIKRGPRKGQVKESYSAKGNRLPNDVWDYFKDTLKHAADKVASLGIAKRNWVELGKRLGFEIKAPQWVQQANFQGKNVSADNTYLKRQGEGLKYKLEIKNTGRNHQWTNAFAFYSKLNGRIAYFRKNVDKAVFADLRQVAKKYPKLKVLP